MAENEVLSGPKETNYDVAVVGAGPAGLFSAFYAGLRGMSVALVDAAPQLGGQLSALYPEKWIYDVGGFERVRAQELVGQMVAQAMRFEPGVWIETQVRTLVEAGEGAFQLGLSSGESLTVRGVIIAAGLGSFKPKRLPAPGLDRWEGKGLVYTVRHLDDLRGKHVVVVGGGDTALDWALMASGVGADVTVVHRRDEFRAVEESVERVKQSPIRLRLSAEVVDADGDGVIRQVHIQHNSGELEKLPADVLLGCLGFQAELGPIASWGLEMEKNTIRTDHMGRTSRPRVYAVGDVANYPGKLKLIATAFSEAAMAVAHLKTQLDTRASLQPAHSSGMKMEALKR
ncbi:MAG: NAD(P)/FAD-dependent oxidoreductase [Symbiobacteriia bacterium]